MKKKIWLLVAAGILSLSLLAPTALGAITGSQNTQNPQSQSFVNGSYGCTTGFGYGGMMNGGYGMMVSYYGNGYNQVPNQGDSQKAEYNVDLKVSPGSKLGPDGEKHDAFSPANFTLKVGVPVKITISNYDNMPHSLTSPALGLNIQAKEATSDGQPGITTFIFTPHNAGDYHWLCIDPCDLEANGWAMSQDGYMQGTIHVQA